MIVFTLKLKEDIGYHDNIVYEAKIEQNGEEYIIDSKVNISCYTSKLIKLASERKNDNYVRDDKVQSYVRFMDECNNIHQVKITMKNYIDFARKLTIELADKCDLEFKEIEV